MRWVDDKHILHQVYYGMKVVATQIKELRLKHCEHNEKMFLCENFTCVVDSLFDQRASFVVVFEKQRVHVANVLDEVLQANHDVDIESNRVELPDCRKKGPPISEKRTVREIYSMSNAQLQEPGHVVGVLDGDDAKSQQNDFSESSL